MGKELKSLNRRELIEIIYQLKKNEQNLQNENEALKRKLEDKQIKLSEVGSIAEASLAVSDIFTVAQSAADQYLAEIERRRNDVEKDYATIIAHAQKKADQIVNEAVQQRDQITAQAKDAYKKLKKYEAVIEKMKQDIKS